jgi:hypothetical protein
MHVDSRGDALPDKRVLILGCGHDSSCPDSHHAHLGCDTLDIVPGRRPTFLRDMWGLGSHPLPVPDKYYDLVFTEHCPLFLDRCKPVDKLHGVVRELFRIAKSPDAVRVEIVERLPLWTVEEIARFVSCPLTNQMLDVYEGGVRHACTSCALPMQTRSRLGRACNACCASSGDGPTRTDTNALHLRPVKHGCLCFAFQCKANGGRSSLCSRTRIWHSWWS